MDAFKRACVHCVDQRYENDSWIQMLETMQDKIRTKLE